MYDDGSSYNFLNAVSLVIENTIGISLIAQKRRHIAGMVRMCCVSRVIVHSCVAEIIAAVSGFVYVHGVEAAGTGEVDIGKPEDFRLHQHAAVGGVVKSDSAAQFGILCIAFDPCDSSGMILQEKVCENSSGGKFVIRHKKLLTAFELYYEDSMRW